MFLTMLSYLLFLQLHVASELWLFPMLDMVSLLSLLHLQTVLSSSKSAFFYLTIH